MKTSEHTICTEILSDQTDSNGQLKLSSFLELCQRATEEHMSKIGLPIGYLLEKLKITFVITQTHVKIIKLPKKGEKIFITTRCEQIIKTRFLRNFTTKTQDGQIVIKCRMSYQILDAQEHKLVRRPQQIQGLMPLFKCYKKSDSKNPLMQHIKTPDCEYSFDERKIKPEDIDYNGHVNNTIYAKFLFEKMPEEFRQKNLREFCIDYLKEQKLNEKLKIGVYKTQDIVYFVGMIGDKKSFSSFCRFNIEKKLDNTNNMVL